MPEAANENGADKSALDQATSLKDISRLLRGDQGEGSESRARASEPATIDGDRLVEDVAKREGAAKAGESEGSRKRPLTAESIAEALGVEAKELWTAKVTVAEGKQMTLGELKDAAKEKVDFEAKSLAWSEERTKQENTLARARAELREVIDTLPQSALAEDVWRKAQDRLKAKAEAERDRVLDVISDWRDAPELEKKDRDGMAAYIEDYGYSRAEFDRVVDHRMIKLIRDSWQRLERVKAAVERVQKLEAESKGGRKGKRPDGQGAKTPDETSTPSTQTGKVQAIKKILADDARARVGE